MWTVDRKDFNQTELMPRLICIYPWSTLTLVVSLCCGSYPDSYPIAIWAATWDSQQCGMCDQQSLRSACAYAQSDLSFCLSLEYSMSVKLLTIHYFEFLSLWWGCTGSSESTFVKKNTLFEITCCGSYVDMFKYYFVVKPWERFS